MYKEASRMHKHPISLRTLRQVPQQFSWVDQRLVRERYIDQLSPEACALYLFLITVADAQGLSYYAEPSLCQRLSLTVSEIHQARQGLITRGLIDYHRFCQIKDLHAHQGLNASQIAKAVFLDRRTVAYWLTQDHFRPRKPRPH